MITGREIAAAAPILSAARMGMPTTWPLSASRNWPRQRAARQRPHAPRCDQGAVVSGSSSPPGRAAADPRTDPDAVRGRPGSILFRSVRVLRSGRRPSSAASLVAWGGQQATSTRYRPRMARSWGWRARRLRDRRCGGSTSCAGCPAPCWVGGCSSPSSTGTPARGNGRSAACGSR
jgi:hypothetical protein